MGGEAQAEKCDFFGWGPGARKIAIDHRLPSPANA